MIGSLVIETHFLDYLILGDRLVLVIVDPDGARFFLIAGRILGINGRLAEVLTLRIMKAVDHFVCKHFGSRYLYRLTILVLRRRSSRIVFDRSRGPLTVLRISRNILRRSPDRFLASRRINLRFLNPDF